MSCQIALGRVKPLVRYWLQGATDHMAALKNREYRIRFILMAALKVENNVVDLFSWLRLKED